MYRGDKVVESWGYNIRLQPTSIVATRTGVSLLSLGFSHCFGAEPCSTNNGNLLSQSISFPSRTAGSTTLPGLNVTQTYSYDLGMNRLLSFSEGVATAPSQTYSYDAFGNRWLAGINWVPYTGQTPVANVFSNNRWAPGSGAQYDAAGNQKQLTIREVFAIPPMTAKVDR
jgi:hypothetical protein